jgi:hypothetical protein
MPPIRVRSRPLDALVGHLGDRLGRLRICRQSLTMPATLSVLAARHTPGRSRGELDGNPHPTHLTRICVAVAGHNRRGRTFRPFSKTSHDSRDAI